MKPVALFMKTIFVFADKEGPITFHILHYLKQGTREEIPAQCCYSNCPSEQAGGQWSDAEGKQQLSIITDWGRGGGNAGTFTAIRHYGSSCSQDGERGPRHDIWVTSLFAIRSLFHSLGCSLSLVHSSYLPSPPLSLSKTPSNSVRLITLLL